MHSIYFSVFKCCNPPPLWSTESTVYSHYSTAGTGCNPPPLQQERFWFFSKNDMHFTHAFLAQTTRRPKPAFSSIKCMFLECFLHVQPCLLKFERKSGNMHFGPAPLEGENTHFPRENACFWISSMHFWLQALEGQNMHFPRKNACFLHVATWIPAFWGKLATCMFLEGENQHFPRENACFLHVLSPM